MEKEINAAEITHAAIHALPEEFLSPVQRLAFANGFQVGVRWVLEKKEKLRAAERHEQIKDGKIVVLYSMTRKGEDE